MKIRIPYDITNNGDGSASIRLHSSEQAAMDAQEAQNEEGDGFAEDCSGTLEIEVDDRGRVYFEKYDHTSRSHVRVEIPQQVLG